MLNVTVVVGTRPEAIKLAPVAIGLQSTPGVCASLLHSGQHAELAIEALKAFDLVPDASLSVLMEGQSLGSLTARCLTAFETYARDNPCDYVVVQGDTTTAMACAMGAFYQGIPVGHVEAGLRTHDLRSPFPEEANRQLLARLATDHFSPTSAAVTNLESEGVPTSAIHLTGNTIVDALRILGHRDSDGTPRSMRPIHRKVVVTMHRRENHRDLDSVYSAVYQLAIGYPEVSFMIVGHPNPSVAAAIQRAPAPPHNLKWAKPMPYVEFLGALSESDLVITDSGGVQEEAVSIGRPVVVVRSLTERMEGVDLGLAHLVGTEPDAIFRVASELLQTGTHGPRSSNVYGDGYAAERIVEVIRGRLGGMA